MYACIFQTGNFTEWGSEWVKLPTEGVTSVTHSEKDNTKAQQQIRTHVRSCFICVHSDPEGVLPIELAAQGPDLQAKAKGDKSCTVDVSTDLQQPINLRRHVNSKNTGSCIGIAIFARQSQILTVCTAKYTSVVVLFVDYSYNTFSLESIGSRLLVLSLSYTPLELRPVRFRLLVRMTFPPSPLLFFIIHELIRWFTALFAGCTLIMYN